MTSLYLSDIMKRAGLDPKKVMLIRHSLGHEPFKKCYDKNNSENGFVHEYTSHQGENFAKGAEYWMVFVSDHGTKARFFALYKVTGSAVKSTKEMMNDAFPMKEWYGLEGDYVHFIEKSDIMSDLENKLVIEWGKATTAWYQWGTNEKGIVSIQTQSNRDFSGFDTLCLSFDELEEIINDEITYKSWHTALKSVYAVYLIADKTDGKLYVGSASGDNGGLLQRWTDYVQTKHGGNKKMKERLDTNPDRYHDFQFQILQILPPTMIKSDVDKIESLWKEKLLTRKFGMNDN